MEYRIAHDPLSRQAIRLCRNLLLKTGTQPMTPSLLFSSRKWWTAPAACLLAAILSLCNLHAADMTTTVYMMGDSTMANKSTANGNPERGWGQLLPEFFQPQAVVVVNRAKDGRSTKSFQDEGLWKPILEAIRPGDWLIIQFGHNDQKKDKPQVYADAATDYRQNLTRFVQEARAKGAHPILATSIYRRQYTPEGEIKATLGAYPETVRQLAKELAIPLVDLNALTLKLLEEEGEEK